MFKPGVAEFEVDGVKRGFKHGTWARAVACEEMAKRKNTKYSVDDLDKDIGLYGGEVDLTALMCFYYGCAVHYCESKKAIVDFSPVDVSDWLDELGLDKVTEITGSIFKQHEPKNALTLEEVQTPG
jgi:hypothetical protein